MKVRRFYINGPAGRPVRRLRMSGQASFTHFFPALADGAALGAADAEGAAEPASIVAVGVADEAAVTVGAGAGGAGFPPSSISRISSST